MVRKPSRTTPGRSRAEPMVLRIIGGTFRGRRLRYDLDQRTRPMKDRIRQAIFNMVGLEAIRDAIVLDLFAGTGLLALEAISRGAAGGVAIERSPRLAVQLRKHCHTLGLHDRLQVMIADTLRSLDRLPDPTKGKWLAFICPPYAMFSERTEELLFFIEAVSTRAPTGSTIVVEYDQTFDAARLPDPDQWSTRCYRPTIIAWRKLDHVPPQGDIPPQDELA